MIVDELSLSVLSRLVFVFRAIEIHTSIFGPFDDHFARFLKDYTEFLPERFVAKVITWE
jgi:hypothetical protein